MCGIAGMVRLPRLDKAEAGPRLRAALARLAGRGPDGEGTWLDERCALGHRRLAVIDLSEAANQPMVRDGLALTYNGEIYNYLALRAELEALGRSFQTRSDTEVLLEGWRQWGESVLGRIDGMFAFALWDMRAGALHLARDRFGKKPLAYAADGRGGLAFGSGLDALEALEGTRRPIDRRALRLYFALRYVPEPWTILEGAAKLPAGHLARFDSGGLAVRPWYDLAAERPAPPPDMGAAEAELRRRLDAAVAARTVADVPLGAFLSGGIDSAVVAASLVRAAPRVRTFTVGFPGASAYYEERPAAREVAAHLGTEHTEIEVGPRDALAAVDQVFAAYDEPFADSSALPTFLLSRETRRHVTVALSGDGADEVFAGYRKHQGEIWAARYAALPRPLRRGLVEPLLRLLPESKDSALLERVRRLRRFAAHAAAPPAARQAGWAMHVGEAELDALLGPDPAAPSVPALFEAARAAARTGDAVNAMLHAEIALGLAGDMLVKVDRASMAHGLEVRCPFLSAGVVELAASLPGVWKLAPGEGKRILRRAFAARLPEAVFRRPKKGFEVPVARWLTDGLADRARRAVDAGRLSRQGLVRPGLPERWLDDLRAGRRDTSWPLWSLIALQGWLESRGRDGEAGA